MKREFYKEVIRSTDFLLPSIFIFIGVTGFYIYESPTNSGDKLADKAWYWLAYLIISIFLQFVVFVNARKQIINRQKHEK